MLIAHRKPRRDDPAGAGSIAFLNAFAVLVVVRTTARWATYLG